VKRLRVWLGCRILPREWVAAGPGPEPRLSVLALGTDPAMLEAALVKRRYRCPECGWETEMSPPKTSGWHDINFQTGCVPCATLHGKIVWLVETSDPRDEPIQGSA
jgi:hypothetical protein